MNLNTNYSVDFLIIIFHMHRKCNELDILNFSLFNLEFFDFKFKLVFEE